MKRQRKPLTLGDTYKTIETTAKGVFDVYAPDAVYRRKTLSILSSNEKPFNHSRWLLRIDKENKSGELLLYPKNPSSWYLFIGVICYPDLPELSKVSVYVMPQNAPKSPEAVEWQKKLRDALKKAKKELGYSAL